MTDIHITSDLTVGKIMSSSIIVISIPKEDTESGNVKRLSKELKKFEKAGVKGGGKMIITFDGYDDIPDEIYEISAIRKYVEKAFRKYPYLLYFSFTEKPFSENNADLLIACVADTLSVKKPERYPILDLNINYDPRKQAEMLKAIIGYGLSVGDTMENIMKRMLEIEAFTILKTL